MYVAMENGDIYFLEVDAHSHQLVQTATKASYFDCSIGTAFAVLDYGLKKNDMIVAGGEMSSGGIYLVGKFDLGEGLITNRFSAANSPVPGRQPCDTRGIGV